jgi:hypothetical protein
LLFIVGGSIAAVSRTLLVNFWYSHAVGHAIEALRLALGFHLGDPSLRISVLLNGATPTELGDWCPFVERTYAAGFTDFLRGEGDPDGALADVPRDWSYVVENWRADEAVQQRFTGLVRWYEASRRHFRPRISEPPPYVPHGTLRLKLTTRRKFPARGIAVLPAGSSERSRYPSAASWELVLRALAAEVPGAVFCLVGKTPGGGRTFTRFTEFDRLAAAVPRAVDAVDLPLAEQLALVEACELFVSPHTGFGTAALAVGTPWLALAGGRWHEYLCNGVPFVSVQPNTTRYPAYAQFGADELVDDDGEPRTPSMTRARIEEDLPRLLAGARELLEGRLSYEDACRRHFEALLVAYRGDRSKIFTFDSIHEQYI